MIEIDGSYGTGGGQIIRTALGLSVLTGKAFHAENIRVKRTKPGLAAQHLTGVKTAAQLCSAKIKGDFIGSTELWFEPGKIKTQQLKIDVGTAGSISLVLQALMPALIRLENKIKIEITGGTDVKMAPSIDYIGNVLLKLLEKIGYKASLSVIRRGFFPKGGGIIKFEAEPMKLSSCDFIDAGKPIKIQGLSIASKYLEKAKVAERQAEEARKLLKAFKELNLPVSIKSEYAETYSPGSVITLWLETDKTVIGSSALGERGKPAEKVAREAVEQLIKEYKQNSVVDVYASDQLMPYLALTGGSLKTSRISEHAKTNAFVIEKFLDVKFEIGEKEKIISVKKLD